MKSLIFTLLVALLPACTNVDQNTQKVITACEKFASTLDNDSRNKIRLCENQPGAKACRMYTYEKVLFGTVIRNQLDLRGDNELVDAFHALGINDPEAMSDPILAGITAKNVCDKRIIIDSLSALRQDQSE